MPSNRVGRVAKTGVSLFLLTVLVSVFLSPYMVQQAQLEPATWTVDEDGSADFRTIQEAINAAQHDDSINVRGGSYQEHVIVNRSVSLTGEHRSTTIIDGGGSGTVVLVTADNVTLRGVTVRNGKSGIIVSGTRSCTITESLVEENDDRGVLITMARDCTVSRNHAFGSRSGYGINVNASQNVLVEENGASNNYFDGIGLLASNNSIVRGNTVNGNTLYGLWVQHSRGNRLYLNNVFGNGKQVVDNTPLNSWDYGSAGNYWSDYGGADVNGDGVGDEPYTVDELTQQLDHFPLVHPYANEIYLSIDREPPLALFTYAPDVIFVNEPVGFDASGSYDSVGRNAIVEYIWNLGDGSLGTGIQINHTYLAPGNFTVALTVVDAAGNEGFASGNIHIGLKDTGDGQFLLIASIGVLTAGVLVGITLSFLWFKRKKSSLSSVC